MDEHELAHMIMDDDGAGSAITSVPAGQAYYPHVIYDESTGKPAYVTYQDGTARHAAEQAETSERQAIRTVLARRYGPAIPVTEDMIDAVQHEVAFAALPEDEQASRYAKFEQGTAGAWLGTYTS